MGMGAIAGLIAAIAFAVLVIYLCLNLAKLMKIMDELKTTVQRANKTIDIVTKDVDNLSIEVEGLLNKANGLVDDVNGKVAKTDPLFTAIGDLGITVSDLNDSTRQMTVNLMKGVGKKKTSSFDKIVQTSLNRFKSRKKPNQTNYEPESVDFETSKLEAYRPTETPASAAGDITIH